MSAAALDVRHWQPERPRLRPVQLLLSWLLSALALLIAAEILPGAAVNGTGAHPESNGHAVPPTEHEG